MSFIISQSSQALITRLGVLTLILLIVFAILVSVTRLLGSPSMVPVTLKPSLDCAVDCWNGIHIGKTTMDEAESILRKSHFAVNADPYWHNLVWSDDESEQRGNVSPEYDATGKWRDKVGMISISVSLTDKSKVSLGDAIKLWGQPIGMSIEFCVYQSYKYGYLTIFFKGGVLVQVDPSRQINNAILSPSALTPNTVITVITYDPKDTLHYLRGLQIWKGFVRFPPDYLISDYCG